MTERQHEYQGDSERVAAVIALVRRQAAVIDGHHAGAISVRWNGTAPLRVKLTIADGGPGRIPAPPEVTTEGA